ncbi:MAG TPA: hypothetical protein VFD36_00425, partial [Kofleriaceae bacterium]|nr:hypothetical protein [Kofleriaceae bacterium]
MKYQYRFMNPDDVVGLQQMAASDSHLIYVRAIVRTKVTDRDHITVEDQPRVLPRDRPLVDPQISCLRAADDHCAARGQSVHPGRPAAEHEQMPPLDGRSYLVIDAG